MLQSKMNLLEWRKGRSMKERRIEQRKEPREGRTGLVVGEL
jgi:hypothetical protein